MLVYSTARLALIARALALAVAVCYRNNMLQELYAFSKLFNKMIGRAI